MSTNIDTEFDVKHLAEERLLTPDGVLVRLGDLWQDRHHLVLFLRHFG